MGLKRSSGYIPAFGSSIAKTSGAVFVDTMTSTGANPSITVPAGIASGDLCIWAMATRNAAIPATGPEGDSSWTTLVSYDTGTDEEHAIFYKIADGSEPSTWDMTIGTLTTVGVIVVRGPDTITDFAYNTNNKNCPSVYADAKSLQFVIALGSYLGSIAVFTDLFSELDARISVNDGTDAQVVIMSRDTNRTGPTKGYSFTGGSSSPYITAATVTFT